MEIIDKEDPHADFFEETEEAIRLVVKRLGVLSGLPVKFGAMIVMGREAFNAKWIIRCEDAFHGRRACFGLPKSDPPNYADYFL